MIITTTTTKKQEFYNPTNQNLFLLIGRYLVISFGEKRTLFYIELV